MDIVILFVGERVWEVEALAEKADSFRAGLRDRKERSVGKGRIENRRKALKEKRRTIVKHAEEKSE